MQNTFQIPGNLIVCKSNNSKSQSHQICLTLRIIFFLKFVYIAIHFHDQLMFMTVKICKISVNNLLSAEMQVIQPIRFDFLPKNLFGRRHFTPQFLGILKLFGRNFLSSNNILYRHTFPSPLPC